SATPMRQPQRSTRQSQTISKPKRFRPPSVGSTATRKDTNELSKQSSPNTWQAGVPHLESTSGHGLRRYVQNHSSCRAVGCTRYQYLEAMIYKVVTGTPQRINIDL